MKLLRVSSVVFILLFFAVSACTSLRGAKRYDNPSSPCEANYKSEGNQACGFKTSSSVNFIVVTDYMVFDAATAALTDSGYIILSSDKPSGTITAHYSANDLVRAKLSFELRKVVDEVNVAIKISSPGEYGDIPADCCDIIAKMETKLNVKAIGPSTPQDKMPEKVELPPQPPAKETGVPVKLAKAANVRPDPSTKKAPVAVLKAGSIVEKLSQQQAGWIKIRLADGKEGWIHKSMLK